MSRVGRLPVPVPSDVKVTIAGPRIEIAGPKGEAALSLHPVIDVELANGALIVKRKKEGRKERSLHGMTRKLVANMVEGVSRGFTRVLEINGTGYRAEVKESSIVLSLGFSHPVSFRLPPGVEARVDRQTLLTLSGVDRQVLGEVAAGIRRLRPPEPYKGKGIKYSQETLRRKAGKTAGA